MTKTGKLIKIFAPILLRIAFLLHLRIPWSLLIRWIKKENKRAPIPNYMAPGNIELVMSKFQYKKDPLEGQIDYVSHPEYVQAVLNDPDAKDGDCDDGHWFVANAMKKCVGVTEVYYLSCGFSSSKIDKDSGHAVCVYKYNNSWFLYDWKIYPIGNPNDAMMEIAKRYTGDENAQVTYYVWESVGEEGNNRSNWKPLAICKPLVANSL